MRASRCTGSRPKSRILRRLALARGVGGERPPTAAVPDMIPAALRRALCFHAGSGDGSRARVFGAARNTGRTMWIARRSLLVSAVSCWLPLRAFAQPLPSVDLALVLAVDASGSVDQ